MANTCDIGGLAMSHGAQVATLKSLQLNGMAHAWGELAQQGSPLYQTAHPMLDALLKPGNF